MGEGEREREGRGWERGERERESRGWERVGDGRGSKRGRVRESR